MIDREQDRQTQQTGLDSDRVLENSAMFVTTGMAILTSVFPPHRRGRAIGIYVAAVYIGLSVGPFAGGVLTQHLGWHSLYSATFAITFLLSLYLQYLKSMPPQTTGAVLMAQPIVMALLSPLAGRLSDRVEARMIASAGMLVTVLGLINFGRLQSDTPTSTIIGTLVLVGFGFALFSSPNMSAIMGAVDKKYYGAASGTVATMRLLGQMFSMAIATVILTLYIGHEPIQLSNHPEFLQSIKKTFAIFALLCAAGVYFSFARGRMTGQRPKTV